MTGKGLDKGSESFQSITVLKGPAQGLGGLLGKRGERLQLRAFKKGRGETGLELFFSP